MALMENDGQEIDYEAELAQQPWWFRLRWRFAEWRRQRMRTMCDMNPYDEPPEEWYECDACNGEGEVFDHVAGSRWSLDPPFEVYVPCGKCSGAGGWLDERKPDSEGDYCPYRHFTDEESAAWERVFEGLP